MNNTTNEKSITIKFNPMNIAIAIAAIAAVIFLYSLLFGKSTISVSEISITDLQSISQLKVLTFTKDVALELRRTEKGILYDSHYKLARKVSGKINIGFDLSKKGNLWLEKTSDSTVVANLPAIQILNKDNWYIDETTSSSIDNDPKEWNQTERKKLTNLLNAKIKHDCEIERCYEEGELQAEKLIKSWLVAFGFKENNITINITPRVDYGAVSWKKEYASDFEKKCYIELSRNENYYNKILFVDDNHTILFGNDCSEKDVINLIYSGKALNNYTTMDRFPKCIGIRDNQTIHPQSDRDFFRRLLNSNDSILFIYRDSIY